VAVLELVAQRPDWQSALVVALALPSGMSERRRDQDPWTSQQDRPRRISDDLAWLRDAYDEPAEHGLKPVPEPGSSMWSTEDDERVAGTLIRLRNRGVLDAAGFLMHDEQ